MKELENCYFKYTTLNQNVIHSLLSEQLWHAEADSLNDPFEFNFAFKEGIKAENADDLARILKENRYFVKEEEVEAEKEFYLKLFVKGDLDKVRTEIENAKNVMKTAIRSTIDKVNFLVCSLSKKYDNSMMWCHYADGLKGICIAYDIDLLYESDLSFKDVKYSESAREIDFEKAYKSIILGEVSTKEEDEFDLFSILLSKHDKWKDEHEVRSICVGDEDEIIIKGSSYQLSNNTIKAIIYGSKIRKTELEILQNLSQKLNFSLYKATPKHGTFSVETAEG
ncbi:DUF2971 domain-containing protein [Shewanella atlantica]|nr:DUF2971 domain-containing protein [Shewanella atlantica]